MVITRKPQQQQPCHSQNPRTVAQCQLLYDVEEVGSVYIANGVDAVRGSRVFAAPVPSPERCPLYISSIWRESSWGSLDALILNPVVVVSHHEPPRILACTKKSSHAKSPTSSCAREASARSSKKVGKTVMVLAREPPFSYAEILLESALSTPNFLRGQTESARARYTVC